MTGTVKHEVKRSTISPLTKAKLISLQHKREMKKRAFTITMLQDRWDKDKNECSNILQRFKVPGYIWNGQSKDFDPNSKMIDKAFFFEEYIYAIERRLNLPHVKLKSRTVEKLIKGELDAVRRIIE